ncbi:unnamed protein product [Linum tenue]|uniref:Peptidase A2 domain-containing protein n=1 Tax=Linum tenue TaxID=586396 RepID=A0AAV0Q453_9ROSI|nr:unnamed protein product [Linum tenue]
MPRFKLVVDTSPPPSGSSDVAQGASSSQVQEGPRLDPVEEEKLCAQCRGKLTIGGAGPSQSVHQRLGPRQFKPRYPSYERSVEGVRAPAWGRGQRRQWVAQSAPPFESLPFGLAQPVRGPPPVRRTFRMPNVPRGGWHTYDVRRQQPIAVDAMTRTQYRRYLRKNAQGRRIANLQANVNVDNSATGLRVTVAGAGKVVEDNLDGNDQGVPGEAEYDAELDDSLIEEEMLELEEPKSKFDRKNKDDDDDNQGAPMTIQFGSLPPVVVNNYILPLIFHIDLENQGEDGEVVMEVEELDEAAQEVNVAELVSGFAQLTLEEENEEPAAAELVGGAADLPIEAEPWSAMMARTNGWIDLAVESARQNKSSQRILKELYEAGHKAVGPLGEDEGRYPFYVLYQGPKESTSVPVENITWESDFDKLEKSIQAAEAKAKAVDEGTTCEESNRVVVFNEPKPKMMRHLRPLYIRATLDDVPMSRVLVDNGAAVNVMPTRMLKKLGKNTNDLIPTEVFVTSFNGGSTSARGILPVVVGVGSQKRMSAFFVVDGMISYNALLGRDWIHANKCVPSSLHQCLMFWNEDGVVEVVQADTKPFAVGANVAEAFLYHGDFGPLEIRSGDGGTTNVIVSSARVLSKACLDPLSEIMRPSMLALGGPPKSE